MNRLFLLKQTFLILFLLFALNLTSQINPPFIQPPCTNLDFEQDTIGWIASAGFPSTGLPGALHPNYSPLFYGFYQAQIVTAGTDYYGGFPKTIGAKSMMLGTPDWQDALAGCIEQTFLVTATNSLFIVNYAAVLEFGLGHTTQSQTFLYSEIIDSAGNHINCGEISETPDENSWTLSNQTGPFGGYYVYYKPWSTMVVNLNSFIGQTITVRIMAGDCSLGGHFGYAYIDCSCAPFEITNQSQTICSGDSVTLTAYPNALSYLWNPGSETTNSILVAPTMTTTYTCDITTEGISPCTDTTSVTVFVIPNTPVNFITNSPICENDTLTLTALNGTNFNWSGPNSFTSTLQTPIIPNISMTESGTYSLTIVDSNNCSSTAQQAIIVYPKPIAKFIPSSQIASLSNPNIIFTDVSEAAIITGWDWDFGDKANTNDTVQNPNFSYSLPGDYIVSFIVTSENGCIDSTKQTITITDDVVSFLPNSFSPNGDNLNDLFIPIFSSEIEEKTYLFTIYNRWGEVVFSSINPKEGWNGKYKNHLQQDGSYTWQLTYNSVYSIVKKSIVGNVIIIK